MRATECRGAGSSHSQIQKEGVGGEVRVECFFLYRKGSSRRGMWNTTGFRVSRSFSPISNEGRQQHDDQNETTHWAIDQPSS